MQRKFNYGYLIGALTIAFLPEDRMTWYARFNINPIDFNTKRFALRLRHVALLSRAPLLKLWGRHSCYPHLPARNPPDFGNLHLMSRNLEFPFVWHCWLTIILRYDRQRSSAKRRPTHSQWMQQMPEPPHELEDTPTACIGKLCATRRCTSKDGNSLRKVLLEHGPNSLAKLWKNLSRAS